MNGCLETPRRTHWWRALAAALALSVTLAFAGPAPSTWAAARKDDGWSIIDSPPVKAGGWLEATATISTDDVWAVGLTFEDGPLAEHWDGTSWTRTNTRMLGWAGFWGVAAVGPRDVWAVGSHSISPSITLIEHWNGTRWKFVPSPLDRDHEEQLQGVYATSKGDVWAVGWRGKHPLVEHWNGAKWRVVKVPSPSNGGGLNSISGSGPTDIWAVGFRGPAGWNPAYGTLVEHWDGSRWSIVDAPGAKAALSLNSVVALGPNDAWAVGGLPRDPIFAPDGRSVSEHWDGRRWTNVPTARGVIEADSLNAVAAGPDGVVGRSVKATTEIATARSRSAGTGNGGSPRSRSPFHQGSR
jgi:hypothetical protein